MDSYVGHKFEESKTQWTVKTIALTGIQITSGDMSSISIYITYFTPCGDCKTKNISLSAEATKAGVFSGIYMSSSGYRLEICVIGLRGEEG